MIHELQSFADLLFASAMTAAFLYGVILFARRLDWQRAPEQFWRHPSYVPFILCIILVSLECIWLTFGLMVEVFGVSHFTQGRVYNSTQKIIDKTMGWSGFLMIMLSVGESVYIRGLRPLSQKLKAAMKL